MSYVAFHAREGERVTPTVPWRVGDETLLPDRLVNACAKLGGRECGMPDRGRVASIEDGWVMVHCGSWGQFGMPVGDLSRPTP